MFNSIWWNSSQTGISLLTKLARLNWKVNHHDEKHRLRPQNKSQIADHLLHKVDLFTLIKFDETNFVIQLIQKLKLDLGTHSRFLFPTHMFLTHSSRFGNKSLIKVESTSIQFCVPSQPRLCAERPDWLGIKHILKSSIDFLWNFTKIVWFRQKWCWSSSQKVDQKSKFCFEETNKTLSNAIQSHSLLKLLQNSMVMCDSSSKTWSESHTFCDKASKASIIFWRECSEEAPHQNVTLIFQTRSPEHINLIHCQNIGLSKIDPYLGPEATWLRGPSLKNLVFREENNGAIKSGGRDWGSRTPGVPEPQQLKS